MKDLTVRLRELGLTLPPAPKPAAVYIPAMRTGNLIIVSGQIPIVDGKPMLTGPVPSAVTIDDAQKAARQCILNGLAIIDHMLAGDWSQFVRFVRLGVFVNCDHGFGEQHLVANGASLLLEEIFGEDGRHARAAVGAPGLPLHVPVEVEMMVEVQ